MSSLYDGIRSMQSISDAALHPDKLRESRATALNTAVDGIVVDTVRAFDTGIWETGILDGTKPWVVVEQYPDEKLAKEGHDKWVSKVKSGERTFVSIQDKGEFDWND